MNERQISLARHALGLPNDRKVSYRNRSVVGTDGMAYNDWEAMVAEGAAVRSDGATMRIFRGRDMFKLTTSGALNALQDSESLDPEDFPDTLPHPDGVMIP